MIDPHARRFPSGVITITGVPGGFAKLNFAASIIAVSIFTSFKTVLFSKCLLALGNQQLAQQRCRNLWQMLVSAQLNPRQP
jgi:hypothetical protein